MEKKIEIEADARFTRFCREQWERWSRLFQIQIQCSTHFPETTKKHFLRLCYVQSPIFDSIYRQDGAPDFKTSQYRNSNLGGDQRISAFRKHKEGELGRMLGKEPTCLFSKTFQVFLQQKFPVSRLATMLFLFLSF